MVSSEMTQREHKPLMRSLGEFVGHLARAVKADVGDKRAVVNKTTQEATKGNVTLRRTTIEEIEIRDKNP